MPTDRCQVKHGIQADLPFLSPQNLDFRFTMRVSPANSLTGHPKLLGYKDFPLQPTASAGSG